MKRVYMYTNSLNSHKINQSASYHFSTPACTNTARENSVLILEPNQQQPKTSQM